MIPEEWYGLPTIQDRLRRLWRMRKKVSVAGDLFKRDLREAGARYWVAFVTLTYGPDVPWAAKHIRTYTDAMRKIIERRGHRARYLWVAELQGRGAVHYHLMFWLPEGVKLPIPDQGYWPHGMSNIQKCRGNGVGYLLKYLSKGAVGQPFPKGCRTYGHGGLNKDSQDYAAWEMLPRYQRVKCYWFERVRKRGSRWFSPVTGACWRGWVPPYHHRNGGGVCVIQANEDSHEVSPC